MEKLRKEIQSVVDIFTSGNLSKAEILTKELMNDNPRIVFLYNLLGLIYEGQEKRDEAIKCYEQGISIDPNYGMIYNNLGLLFFKNKTDNSIEKAKDFYNKSISLDKRIPEPHNNLGNLYHYVGKTPEAINCYKRALEINPNFSYAHHNLGSAYVAIGKFNEAKKHFIKSIKINPDFAPTHRSLSRITKYTNDDKHFVELKKIYKSVDSKDSEKKIELGFALGKAYEDTKNFDQSFFHYKHIHL